MAPRLILTVATFGRSIGLLILIVGCFIDTIAAITILVPILLPIVLRLGIDPVHFGVVVTLNLAWVGRGASLAPWRWWALTVSRAACPATASPCSSLT